MGESNVIHPWLKTRLLDWYSGNLRALPWRTQKSLYRTVVSEFMLQQTQVSTVLPYYDRWMKRFPDFNSLAESSEAEVVKYWEGLGYYRRARFLRKTAIQWMETPCKPKTYDEWLKYPGVGPYMAAAISSIEFEDPTVVVDGNVIRVISRIFGIDRTFASNQSASDFVRPLAQRIQDQESRRNGDFNQALMEVGATVCRKAEPLCLLCPWSSACVALTTGKQNEIPKLQRKAIKHLEIPRLWVLNDSRSALLLAKNQMEARLSDIYELPMADEKLCVQLDKLSVIKRGISNERISEPVFSCSEEEFGRFLHKKTEPEWIPLESLASVSISGPHRKWISGFLSLDAGSC
jgi:A/G-specific adenine glycosylase